MKKIIFIFSLMIFLIGIVSAVGNATYCCEKTTNGAWCQNAPRESCDASFTRQPTSCEATSYCRMGCCYDSQEGTCMENTPEKVCNNNGGTWAANANCEIPQCGLGCCLMGDQAAFVTQTRCKRLSSIYGLEINFQNNIQDEFTCIASAFPNVKGACVYEQDFAKTCKFTTKKDCDALGGVNGTGTEFHEGFLCSAEELGTECGPSKKTTCVEGKDEVYFVDTCGNLANIYDASKVEDDAYWTKIVEKADSCGNADSNANSRTCGSCDYYLGSVCKKYSRSEGDTQPAYGDNICRDLSCEYKGKEYQHGETWCADAPGVQKITPDKKVGGDPAKVNVPGSRYFRLLCYNGDVTVEPCADFRQQICIQDEVNDFSTAGCRVNRWQDCVEQAKQKDCENNDRRDCQWIKLDFGEGGGESGYECPLLKAVGIDTNGNGGSSSSTNSSGIRTEACVPKFPPGFNFWESGDAESLCSLASTTCVVTYEEGLLGGKTCKSNCECLEDSWADQINKMCIALGDCGSSINYLGFKGFHDKSAFYSGGNKSGSNGDCGKVPSQSVCERTSGCKWDGVRKKCQ